QAEDGIRDRNVTGVQTCALPISSLEVQQSRMGEGLQHRPPHPFFLLNLRAALSRRGAQQCTLHSRLSRQLLRRLRRSAGVDEAEIGRASCRERVWMSGVAEDVEG